MARRLASRRSRQTELAPKQDARAPLMVPFAAYQELVHELVALKRDGFTPTPTGEAPMPAPGLAPEIEAAITDLGLEPATERQVRKHAWDLKRAGLEDDAIAKRITDGEEAAL